MPLTEIETIASLTLIITLALEDGHKVDGAVQQICLLIDDELLTEENKKVITKANSVVDKYLDEHPDYAF